MTNNKAIRELETEINSMLSSEFEEEFVQYVTKNMHRTLQQKMFKLMLKCIAEWSVNYLGDNYDLRNEDTVKLSNAIATLMVDKDRLFFDPKTKTYRVCIASI
jgi:ribonucleotide reductase beta subunit family protein with ferritin-like domain